MCTGDTMGPENVARKSSETRRSNKPIMEKRRRARINNCLNELKNLILDALKKDPARHSKLEKADILEMTVKHLENIQRQTMAMAIAADPNVVNKYRAGFNECVNEVARFLGKVDNLNPQVKQRLLGHLANCINGASSPPEPVQVQLPTINVVSEPTGVIGSLQLVPTQLANGDIAYVVPAPKEPEPKPVPPTAVVAPVVHTPKPEPCGLDLRTEATKEAAGLKVEPEPEEEDGQDKMWRPW